LDCIENEQKQRASKGILLPTRRSLCLGKSIHGDEVDNNNDQRPDISHDHVKEIPNKLLYCGQSCLRELYLKLKQIFEATSEEIGELHTATPVLDNEPLVRPSAT